MSNDDGMTAEQRAAYKAYNAALHDLHAFERRNHEEYERLKGACSSALRDFNLAIVAGRD